MDPLLGPFWAQNPSKRPLGLARGCPKRGSKRGQKGVKKGSFWGSFWDPLWLGDPLF